MNKYVVASGSSLILAALAGALLCAAPTALAAADLRLWLGYGAAGFLVSGIGLEVLRPALAKNLQRFVYLYLGSLGAGLLLLALPSTGWVGIAHRVGWIVWLVAAGDYAYLAWWRPPVSPRGPEPLQDYLAPAPRSRTTDPARDAVARALFAAAPAYLFLVSVAGATGAAVLGSATELLLLLGWLGSAAFGTALYTWPRIMAESAASPHLARWGAVLWHLGLILSVVIPHPWLIALSGAGGLLLAADLAPTLRGIGRMRPYVVGSRRRYPVLGARLGFAASLVIPVPLAAAMLWTQEGMLWARLLALAWAAASSLTLLHHLRPALGEQILRDRGSVAPLLLALASLGIPFSPRAFGVLAALLGAYLAVAWLPGLEWGAQADEAKRRRPVG